MFGIYLMQFSFVSMLYVIVALWYVEAVGGDFFCGINHVWCAEVARSSDTLYLLCFGSKPHHIKEQFIFPLRRPLREWLACSRLPLLIRMLFCAVYALPPPTLPHRCATTIHCYLSRIVPFSLRLSATLNSCSSLPPLTALSLVWLRFCLYDIRSTLRFFKKTNEYCLFDCLTGRQEDCVALLNIEPLWMSFSVG